jgi:hypothetical protein
MSFILFLPGYCLLEIIEIKRRLFTKLEKFVIAFGLSITITNLLMLVLGALKININRVSLLIAISSFSALCLAFNYYFKRNHKIQSSLTDNFSGKQVLLICLVLGISIFIRTIYLQNTMIPSATDMGHHMYWTNEIIQKGIIPNYQKTDIQITNGNYSISQPQNISDFIIGEHLIFAAIALISGLSVLSYLPILVMFSVNIMTLLAILILSLRIFESDQNSKQISIVALFFIGPLFAIAPPQAKFLAGGVIGNVISNLLLPLAIYFFIRALKEKRVSLFVLALLFSMSLFYTHHLSALLFSFTFALGITGFVFFNLCNLKKTFIHWFKLIFSLPTISFLLFAAAFAFLVYTPTYITNKAVNTVVGGVKKVEHTGLSAVDYKFIAGEPRMVFGIFGAILLAFGFLATLRSKQSWKNKLNQLLSQTKMDYGIILLFAWLAVISLITLYPTLLGISIPSGRVANYGVYPLSILAAYFFVKVYTLTAQRNISLVRQNLLFGLFTLSFIFTVQAGFHDNQENLVSTTSVVRSNQTLAAAKYLSFVAKENDQIITDHIYIPSDTWIKIFFMRDYNFPMYRANLERYENGIDRQEKCTLWMISTPNTPESKQCFEQLGVNFALVNRKNDAPQFQKNQNFWQIYSNDELNIYFNPSK